MKTLFLIVFLFVMVSFVNAYPFASVIFSNNDYGCGYAGSGSSTTQTNAIEIGVNIAKYAMHSTNYINVMEITHNGDQPHPDSFATVVNQMRSLGYNANYLGMMTLGVTDITGVNLLFLTGHEAFTFTAAEKVALKAFLDRGGLLFADDCNNAVAGGFDNAVPALINELYGLSFQTLASNHAVYSTHYTLNGADFSYTAAGNGTEWNQQALMAITLQVPEPSTIGLMMFAIFGLFVYRNIRKH